MDYYNGYMAELEHLYYRHEIEVISDKSTYPKLIFFRNKL